MIAERGARARQRGATAIEYVGLIVVAAVIIGGLAVALTQTQVGSRVQAAVCRIVTLGQGECVVTTRDGKSPYDTAVEGEYVALGDSYASGEGAGSYDPDTDFDRGDDWNPGNWGDDTRNRCHRSSNAYSRIIARENTFAGGSSFAACSGAMQKELDNANPKHDNEGPQLDSLNENVSLVTVSVGGNDLGFADVVKDCINNGERGVPFVAKCQKKHNDRIMNLLPDLKKDLVAKYKAMKEKAPNARIIVVGYPALFADNPSDNYANLLFKEDQVWMNEKATDLNAMLREAAKEAGVEFVDPTSTFKGHGIGSSDPWINDLTFGGPGISLVDPGSFHPNAAGQAAEAKLIEDQMKNPQYP